MSKHAKQAKLDGYPSEIHKKTSREKKQIIITKLDSELIWDDLILEIQFKLAPSKTAFSKVRTDLWFNQKTAKSYLFDILHSFGSTDEFTLKTVLNLQGLPSGIHSVRVEMCEPFSSGKNANQTEKEIKVEYTSQTKKARLREVPIVKKIQGEGIAILSETEKHIYKEMKESRKKEITSKREK